MLFTELLEKDSFLAFSSYLTVSLAKELKIIEPKFHFIFKDLCECGSERIVRKNLKEVRCCNPRCYIKLGYYLSDMFSVAGVKGIGDSLCLRIMKYMCEYENLDSHIKFLKVEEKDYPFWMTDHEFSLTTKCVRTLKEKRFTYASLIKTMKIPEFEETSDRVFGNIRNTLELVGLLEKEGGLKTFLSNRGFHDPMKHFYLQEFLEDIVEIESDVLTTPLMPVTNNVIKVVCTGSLTFKGYRIYTQDFIDLCNEMGLTPDGSSRFFSVEDSSAVSSVHYVISDTHNTSSKSNRARERERFEGIKILHTCDEFFELLEDIRRSVLGANEEEG